MKNRRLDIAVATEIGWTSIKEKTPRQNSAVAAGMAGERAHRMTAVDPLLVGRPPRILPASPSELRPLPHFSEDERAAWQLVEILRRHYDVEISFWHSLRAYVVSVRSVEDGSCIAESSNPLSVATAICLSFLTVQGKELDF